MSDVAGGCENGICVPKGVSSATTTLTSSSKAEAEPNPAATGVNKTTIHIDIISDPMCPWCFVGKRGLEEALRQSPNIEAKVNWLPFFLDRNLPEEGEPSKEYFRRHYGDPNIGERMLPALMNAGKRTGIDFVANHGGGLDRYRPTIRSHRLIELAKEQDKQDAMVEALFHMYYEEGKHLNSIEHLVETAEKVGLEGDVESFLKGTGFEEEIYQKADEIKHMAQGAPTFLFTRPDHPQRKPATFSGGQPPASFLRVFEHLRGYD